MPHITQYIHFLDTYHLYYPTNYQNRQPYDITKNAAR